MAQLTYKAMKDNAALKNRMKSVTGKNVSMNCSKNRGRSTKT